MLSRHLKVTLYSSVFFMLMLAALPAVSQTKRKAKAEAAKEGAPEHSFKFKTIVIDPGHGGKDPGAHGAYSNEKTIALSIGKKLKVAINNAISGVDVIMTRSTDKFIELHRRANIANENNANLFISIHCNSSPERVSPNRGVLLLVYGFHRKGEQLEALRENASIFIEKDYKKKYNGYGDDAALNAIVLAAFQQRYRKQSVQFGNLLNHQLKVNNGRKSLGVREQGVLVLQQSSMPGMLLETGFINNPTDEKYLNSEEGQNDIVQSILVAIKKYKESFE
ncbi:MULTISPECIES: N-acetylmuramoyl-L-alanine amidase [unclassified Mucilaginibacter]|uniref:N-acetylmuramoyl-L-alanine amidase family protein n=1 Tax=unclassified Mucilaginibacter TaxID=2617802 RepID=UPI002AC8BA02|nr:MULTISPECIES: N-acetylmuramoyl-L-alanine amidase [unclassified Mucilaginibacter]MEB0261446.1 N-acetylmuramoyl-L-alanine amidase [Mucilaginibacter sp. 10I4]MEB0276968.1 N-acetylmuramoyl-L-alanine amidase [Mucilaginibacter sp. 10B2]MEB0301509.1 N-acetylmuramoyl-L-alanine amidase [Mucilaginibacter sp. 5C4]WPX25068.1 N-acetylmuramoyl-L-alanine amidase [Mucilaginibacter sp. 5C4]